MKAKDILNVKDFVISNSEKLKFFALIRPIDSADSSRYDFVFQMKGTTDPLAQNKKMLALIKDYSMTSNIKNIVNMVSYIDDETMNTLISDLKQRKSLIAYQEEKDLLVVSNASMLGIQINGSPIDYLVVFKVTPSLS